MKIHRNFKKRDYANTPEDWGPSLTIPSQSLTIKELLHNHTRGIGADVNQKGAYYGDVEIPPAGSLDLAEIQERGEALKAQQADLLDQIAEEEEKIKAEQKAKREAAKAAKNNNQDPQGT